MRRFSGDAHLPRRIAPDAMLSARPERAHSRKHRRSARFISGIRWKISSKRSAKASGRRTGPCPSFELDEHQIGDLIAYLKSLER